MTKSDQTERVLKSMGVLARDVEERCEADGWSLVCLKGKYTIPEAYRADPQRAKRLCRIEHYIREYSRLIDIERDAEMQMQLQEIRTLSGPERERYGRAMLGLKGKVLGRKLDYYLVRLGRKQPIETEISSGDIVLVSRGDPIKSDLTATVMSVGRYFVELAFSERPPKWIAQEGIRVDLYVNDVTFKRMQQNLEQMRHLEGEQRIIRDILLDLRSPKSAQPVQIEEWHYRLNPSQEDAVRQALGSEELFLIHGPPGTGKTTTSVEIILQAVRSGMHLLATADSNVAVDNILSKLIEQEGVCVVRVGHPARVDPRLEAYTLAAQMERHPVQKELEEIRGEIEALRDQRDRYPKPTPGMLRGMSQERILTLAQKRKGMRGISAEMMQELAEWIKIDQKITTLYERIRRKEFDAIQSILKEADVVCATNAMVGSEQMEGLYFDLVLIDEAGQQIEPSTLIPALRGKRVVMAGDHRQLPPTVISENDILKRSLFERLMEDGTVPETMLQIQYRMNEVIMDFPNRLMYEGKLIADASVAHRRLALSKAPAHEALLPEYPVVFLDTLSHPEGEQLAPRSTSYENPYEAEQTAMLVKALLECGIDSAEIGVITPYLAQVKRIRKTLEAEGIADVEVKSVDGFQGREKEVILISLVRSNIARAIGFVSDSRRLNVAMTRAKSKLIMIGDSRTLQPNPPFERFFEWLQEEKQARRIEI